MRSTSYSHYICASTIKRGPAEANHGVIQMTTKLLGFLAMVAVFATVLALGGGTAQAATVRWVDALAASFPPGTGCGTSAGYNTISAAIAASIPGDTIRVCPGLYAERVQINKTLTLLGAKA